MFVAADPDRRMSTKSGESRLGFAPMKLLTPTAVRDLMDRHGLSPSRALGQNFLCDPGTIDKIVRLSGVSSGDRVVEIGPGLGSLTIGLLKAETSVLAIEIDQYLIPALREVTEGGDVRVLHCDAMKVDWDQELGTGSWSVVANLPYNVGTPLLLDLLPSVPQFRNYLVMVQAEVGERLAAKPGQKGCGIPSVITSYWGSAAVVGKISRHVFFPQPKVESVLVRIDRAAVPNVDADFDKMMTLVRAGFGQRRKMLRRSLAAFFSEEQIASADVDPTKRAEALDLQAWGRLAALVSPHSQQSDVLGINSCSAERASVLPSDDTVAAGAYEGSSGVDGAGS